MDFRIQQFGDPGQRGSATAGHVDQFRHRHDGPNDGIEIADELHELTAGEFFLIHQIAAVAQNDADDAFDKQCHQHPEQHRDLGVRYIGIFVIHIQFFEGPKFLCFLDEGLDHRNTGETLLGEIRQFGVGLLADIPFLSHSFAHDGGRSQQKAHGDQRKQGKQRVHLPHIQNRQRTHQNGIEEHHHAPTEALLHRIQIVGEITHQIANLVDLIVFPA